MVGRGSGRAPPLLGVGGSESALTFPCSSGVLDLSETGLLRRSLCGSAAADGWNQRKLVTISEAVVRPNVLLIDGQQGSV